MIFDEDMTQPPFGAGPVDHVQYHFFCRELFVSVRATRTPSLQHHSAWLYDGATCELVNSSELLRQSEANYLDIAASAFELAVSENCGLLKVWRDSPRVVAEVRFAQVDTFAGPDPFGNPGTKTFHQPNLDAIVAYQGKTYQGIGYCKRYWADMPRYWGLRFLHAVTADHSMAIWTADATLGSVKYDYFRMVHASRPRLSADPETSYHKLNTVYATVGKTRYKISLSEIAAWQTALRSTVMDSLLSQRYCTMTLTENGEEYGGFALSETCFGTLG